MDIPCSGKAKTPATDKGNDTTVAKINGEEEPTERADKIHKHLVFALLLPHHPFSQEVRKIMTTVAPMFPQMTIVMGNAYDFKEMTSKYFVTSFPKIMYFRTGMYIENFSDDYTVENVAAQLTEWSHALPSAVPIPFKDTKVARNTPEGVRDFDIYAPGAQMRYGLSLQTLPLTAQYPLVDVEVPLWLLPYLPYAQQWNNSAFIERRSATAQHAAAPAPVPSLASPATAEPSAQKSSEVVHSSNSGGGENQHKEENEVPAAEAPATQGIFYITFPTKPLWSSL
jgi:hypothetical protein